MSDNPTASRVDEVVEDLQADENVRPYHINHDTGEVRLWVVPEAADADSGCTCGPNEACSDCPDTGTTEEI